MVKHVEVFWYGANGVQQGSAHDANASIKRMDNSYWSHRNGVHKIRIYAECMLSVFGNLLMLPAVAAYPPLEYIVEAKFVNSAASVRERVKMRNPEPKSTDENGEDLDRYFYLDGVLLGVALSTRNKEDQDKKKQAWERKLIRLAEEEGELELRWFPLWKPAGKFVMHVFSKILLAWYLANIEPLGLSRIDNTIALLIWSLQIGVLEVNKLAHDPGLWKTDVINAIELLASLFGTAGLLMRLHIRGPRVLSFIMEDLPQALSPGHVYQSLTDTSVPFFVADPDRDLQAWQKDEWATPDWEPILQQSMIAMGVGLLILATWCRLLQRDQKFGPLVLSTIEMVKDVINFITLLAGVFVAFGFALVILFRGLHTMGDHHKDGGLPDECRFLLSDENGGGLWPSILALLEIMLGSGPEMSTCLHKSSQAVAAPVVMDVFRVVVTLLALNMLIAQMSTTYDKIREKLATNFQFLSALLVVEWRDTPLIPAPLRILGLPYYSAKAIRKLASWTLRSLPIDALNLWSAKLWFRTADYLSIPNRGRRSWQLLRAVHAQERNEMKNRRIRSIVEHLRIVSDEIEDEDYFKPCGLDSAKIRKEVLFYVDAFSGELSGAGDDDKWRTRQARVLGNLQKSINKVAAQSAEMKLMIKANADAVANASKVKTITPVNKRKKSVSPLALGSVPPRALPPPPAKSPSKDARSARGLPKERQDESKPSTVSYSA